MEQAEEAQSGDKLRVVLLPLAGGVVYLPLAALLQVLKKKALQPAAGECCGLVPAGANLPPANVYDLQTLLYLPPGHHGSKSRILLLQAGGRCFALQVEDILQVADLPRPELQPLQQDGVPQLLQQAAEASLLCSAGTFAGQPLLGLNLPALAERLPEAAI